MIVVTGAAGFIGSCVVAGLNARGREDLILVDHMTEEKAKNLANKKYLKYYEKEDFINFVENENLVELIDAVIHMGACSSTTGTDADYYESNNYQYTLKLAQWCLERDVRYIYASSAATYGAGENGYKDDVETIRKCKPLNLYGESKQKFDEWVLDNNMLDKMVGLKFFNVFGPNEYHKGDMSSVIAKAYQTVVDEGKISLFKSYKEGYADGEQKRDFIYVKDVVDVILYFLDHSEINGIYNVGTGCARTWNDLASALFAAVGKPLDITYIEMPETLQGKYQYFTEADMDYLRSAGYTKPFTSLEDAVKDYSQYLAKHLYL